MHLVKALAQTTAEDITGTLVAWSPQQVRAVRDDHVNWFKQYPALFEYLGVEDVSDETVMGIPRPCTRKGKKLAGFTSADTWLLFLGNVEGTNCITTNDVTNIDNTTGLPTGPVSPDGTSLLKKFEILTNGNVGIKKVGMSVNINGMIGFWVYIGKPTNNTVKMHIGVSTSGTGPANDFNFTNNAVFPDQWNFIVIARSADATSNTNVEAHPFGIVESIYDYTQCRFKSQPITRIDITCEDMAGSVLYFASTMYDWETMPQFVLGGDSSGQYTRDIVLPKFKQYGWVGYIAETFRLASGEVTDWGAYGTTTYLDEVYDAGWDIVSHTVNHLNATAAYPTNAGMARYEAVASKSWLASLGYTRGNEFYVSPQGATNKLVSTVVKNAGYVLQRHGSHDVTQVTPYGVMNPEHIGSLDIGGNGWLYGATAPYQYNYAQIDNLKIWVDMVIKYKGTAFPFWHVVRTLGDTGDGRGVPPDSITMYKSTFELFMDYVATKESQGLCRVVDGFTGFNYGSGR